MNTIEPDAGEANYAYALLRNLKWSGRLTPKIEWQRAGDYALTSVRGHKDAANFVQTFSMWNLARRRGGEPATACMSDLIETFGSAAEGARVTIRIPLDILDQAGLRKLLRFQAPPIQARTAQRNLTPR